MPISSLVFFYAVVSQQFVLEKYLYRAFCILVHCSQFPASHLWMTGLIILSENKSGQSPDRASINASRSALLSALYVWYSVICMNRDFMVFAFTSYDLQYIFQGNNASISLITNRWTICLVRLIYLSTFDYILKSC